LHQVGILFIHLSSTVSEKYHATDNIVTNRPIIYPNLFIPDILSRYQRLRGTLSLRVKQQGVDQWLSLSADVIKACSYASAPHKQRCHIMIYICYDMFTAVKASVSITAELSSDKSDLLYAYSKLTCPVSLNITKLFESSSISSPLARTKTDIHIYRV